MSPKFGLKQISLHFDSVYRQLCINGHFSRREDKKADLLFTASKNMINGRTSLRDHSIFGFKFGFTNLSISCLVKNQLNPFEFLGGWDHQIGRKTIFEYLIFCNTLFSESMSTFFGSLMVVGIMRYEKNLLFCLDNLSKLDLY